MIAKKNRPQNGPGANNLRGGPRVYNNRTAIGGWIENVGGASGFQRGFTTEEFLSTAQEQQLGGKKFKTFGANIPQVDVVANPRSGKDLFHPRSGPGADSWKSSSREMMLSVYQPNKNDLSPASKYSHELDEYRQTWTTDTEEGRKLRFETESRRAANMSAPKHFHAESIRKLPGKPISFEHLLCGLIERYGILGISALRSRIGSVDVTVELLQRELKELEVTMKKNDFMQLVAYMTTSSSFPGDNLLRILTVKASEFNARRVESIYASIFDSERVTPERLFIYLNEAVLPDVAAGVKMIIDGYLGKDGNVGVEEFVQLHCDMFSSQAVYYEEVVENLWREIN